MADARTDGLLERLAAGPVICAEGYLFELERRGYLQAGAFVPEVVLEHPELVAQLHQEFVHAGSDVVEAFTYYAHREKLRLVGKEDALETINRQALAIASGVAGGRRAARRRHLQHQHLRPDRRARTRRCGAMFEEQVGWAVEAGVDFIIGETFSWAQEALLALEVIRATGLPAVVTLAIHREPETREGWTPRRRAGAWRRPGPTSSGSTASAGPRTMLPFLRAIREAVSVPRRRAAGALPHARRRAELPVADRS